MLIAHVYVKIMTKWPKIMQFVLTIYQIHNTDLFIHSSIHPFNEFRLHASEIIHLEWEGSQSSSQNVPYYNWTIDTDLAIKRLLCCFFVVVRWPSTIWYANFLHNVPSLASHTDAKFLQHGISICVVIVYSGSLKSLIFHIVTITLSIWILQKVMRCA